MGKVVLLTAREALGPSKFEFQWQAGRIYASAARPRPSVFICHETVTIMTHIM